jgi:peptidoglycan/LPS O-acetylase OafA/YrhL
LIFHIRTELVSLLPPLTHVQPLLDAGFMGVEVFFVLSGFIIAYNYAERFTGNPRISYWRYLYMRLARLYPVHLAMIVVYLVAFATASRVNVQMGAVNKGVEGIGANLVMLHGLPLGADEFSWNGASWTITYEWFAYMAFPILVFLLVRLRTRWQLIGMATVGVLVTLAGLAVLGNLGYDVSKDHISGVVRIAGEFTAGVAVYGLYRLSGRKRASWDWLVVSAVAGAVVVIVLLHGRFEDSAFLALPFIPVAIFGIAKSSGWVSSLLSSRPFIYAGVTSYSLYMTHPIVWIAMRRLLPAAQYSGDPVLLRIGIALAYFIAALCAAVAMYHIVESPARHLMRGWIGARKRASEEAGSPLGS